MSLIMSFTALFGGAIAPFLLLFSPVSLTTARDGLDWKRPGKAVKAVTENPCRKKKPHWRLM